MELKRNGWFSPLAVFDASSHTARNRSSTSLPEPPIAAQNFVHDDFELANIVVIVVGANRALLSDSRLSRVK